jgi:hypothetical protein
MTEPAKVVNLVIEGMGYPHVRFSEPPTDEEVVRAAMYFADLKAAGWIRTVVKRLGRIGYRARIALHDDRWNVVGESGVIGKNSREALVGLAMFAGAWEGYERVIG